MSMMIPPGAAPPGLPTTPGGGGDGGGGDAGPLDALNQGPVPAQGGMAGLMAALGGGGPGGPGDGGGGPPGLADTDQGQDQGQMDATDHIQAAMQHLMMALAMEPDEEQGAGIAKGMAGIQGILGGKQKKAAQLAALSGPPGGGPPGPAGG